MDDVGAAGAFVAGFVTASVVVLALVRYLLGKRD